jgi:DNA repair protein RadC
MPDSATKQLPTGAPGHRKRLRERFLASPEALPDYELLEMLLFAAIPRGDTKPLAKRLLSEFKSYNKVIKAEYHALAKVEGMGQAAIAAIKAVDYAAQRLLERQVEKATILSRWDQVLDYCHLSMGYLKKEQFRILFLDHGHQLMANEVQQQGTVNHTPVYVREVVQRALELGASSMILVHNHPSGELKPSQADIDITQMIQMAAKPMKIDVIDHLIITKNGHYSFHNHGLL